MKIVVIPDSFKGSLAATEVSTAIAAGLQLALPEAQIKTLPIGDGGENTIAALVAPCQLTAVTATVTGADGAPTQAAYYRTPDGETAYIQASEVLGYAAYVGTASDPMRRTSYGLGELMLQARQAGCRRIAIALGGSATSDGGLGMLQALGASLPGHLNQPAGAADLAAVHELPRLVFDSTVIGLTDVTNPLTGELGAARVFGPQKGLTSAECLAVDAELTRLYPRDVANHPGSGAAGGLGAAILGPLSGQLTSGIDFVLDAIGADPWLAAADIVVTGEGRLDSQSARGKAISGILARLKQCQSRAQTIAFCGALTPGSESALGLTAAFCIGRGETDLATALANTATNLTRTSTAVGHLLALATREA